MAESSLIIRIGGDTSGLKNEVKEAQSALKGLDVATVALGSALAQMGIAALSAGADLAKSMVVDGLAAIDAQAELARNLGATVDGLRSLQIYAGMAGVSQEDLTKSIEKVNKTIGKAIAGDKAATDALNGLKLSAEQLSGLDADDKMAAIADSVRALGLNSEQTTAALSEMGIRGSGLVDVMRQGGDAIREASATVKDFGLSLSAVDVAQVEAANDAMDRIALVVDSVRQQIAVALSPVIQALSMYFTDAAKSSTGFRDQAQAAASMVETAVKGILNTLLAVSTAFSSLKLAATVLAAAIATGFEAVVVTVAEVNDAILVIVNGIITGINLLGGSLEHLKGLTESTFVQGVQAAAQATRDHVGTVYDELVAKLQQPLPSDTLNAYLEQVRTTATQSAEAQANAYAATPAIVDSINTLFAEARMASQAQELADTTAHNELMKSVAMTQVSDLTAMQAQQNEAMKKLSNALNAQQISSAVSTASSLLSTMASSNRSAFEAQKVAAIASATINAYKGASMSLGSYPMPLAGVMAALHVAAGLAQINSIRSQSYSGSSSASSSGSTAAATTAASTASSSESSSSSSGSSSTLMVQGIDSDSLFTGKSVRALAEKLQEHQANGGKVVLV